MDVKKAILKQLDRGFSKATIATDFNCNSKLLNAILNAPDEAYTIVKIPNQKTMTAGINKQEEAV